MTEATPLASEQITQALDKALYLAVCTLAFHGRDRGTDRQERMLDDLEMLAKEVDPLIRDARHRIAALSASPAPSGQGVSGEGHAWSFNADTRDIEFGASPVFKVYEASDFPCLEDDERGEADDWYDAQAQTAVLMLNSLLHTDDEPVAAPAASCAPGEVERAEAVERIKAYIAELLLTLQPFAGAAERAQAENEAREGPTYNGPLAYPWNYVDGSHFADAFAMYSERLDPDDLAALSPQGLDAKEGAHPDDVAVDLFAARMKEKLASARGKGRGGWDDPTQCSTDFLRTLLHEHVAKGDPVDVANFCMMLAHYGASTATPSQRLDAKEGGKITQAAVDAALDAEWATDAGGDVPAVGQSYSIREVMEEFGANLSTREIENAMHTALAAALNPPGGNEWAITYDREGPR